MGHGHFYYYYDYYNYYHYYYYYYYSSPKLPYPLYLSCYQDGVDMEVTEKVPYDRLVVALGSKSSPLNSVPGAADHAMPFYR